MTNMFRRKRTYAVTDVFGISTEILEPSYVDRGALDSEIQRYLKRNVHIALRGESKCGKSWIRQKNLSNPIVVQCRFGQKTTDLYADALSQLGIRLEMHSTDAEGIGATFQSNLSAGTELLAKVASTLGAELSKSQSTTSVRVGGGLDDLRFISEIIRGSQRRFVIEDFHYLSDSERTKIASDLKALWDYQCFVLIIGIWQENNLLLHLNPDLSGRVQEISIFWAESDLEKVIGNGCEALNIRFSQKICRRLVEDSFNNVGILQRIVIGLLDEIPIERTEKKLKFIDNENAFESAAMKYAEQLNAIYQTFARKISRGIRKRQNSTGIYAHMIKAALDADQNSLISGLSVDDIFKQCASREPRIQKGNLKSILLKLDELQTDEDGRGLVLTYDESKEEVFIVDRQLFLYRKYGTVKWPWEGIISDIDASSSGFEGDMN